MSLPAPFDLAQGVPSAVEGRPFVGIPCAVTRMLFSGEPFRRARRRSAIRLPPPAIRVRLSFPSGRRESRSIL
jgi:hypothetical protein